MIEKHAGAVRALITVGDSLFSASSDNSIAEWDLGQSGQSGQPLGAGQPGAPFKQLRSLVGHTDGVFALCEQDGILYSGSADRTCRRWDLRTGTVTQEYCSRRLEETPAVVLELLMRKPLREVLPDFLVRLAPLARLSALGCDVAAALDAQRQPHAHSD